LIIESCTWPFAVLPFTIRIGDAHARRAKRGQSKFICCLQQEDVKRTGTVLGIETQLQQEQNQISGGSKRKASKDDATMNENKGISPTAVKLHTN